MTPPRWLREERRAQARLAQNVVALPATLEFVTKQVVSLRVHAAGLAEQIEGLRPVRRDEMAEPIRWTS